MISIGIEFSTQSAKVLALDIITSEIVYSTQFPYDDYFNKYGTSGGVLPSSERLIRHTSPFMLIEALDLVFQELCQNIDIRLVKAIKLDAMQHCTVYVDNSFSARIASLDENSSLLSQISPSITRKTSPIWEDRSTGNEAITLEKMFPNNGRLVSICGNRAEPRFPAAQILKWAMEIPEEYEKTTHIFLLSAFLTSIIAGKIAPVDTGDGWGTNLNTINIEHPGWSDKITDAIDRYLWGHGITGNLKSKIGRMVHYDIPVGLINHYFSRRYDIPPDTIVLVGTGDNPATLLGCGGNAVISLGSSYTVIGVSAGITPAISGEYNLFGYTPGSVMALSVITNGSKVHDHFNAMYNPKGNMDSYVQMAGEPILSEQEPLMIPWLFDESVPRANMGIMRDNFDDTNPYQNIRALHISQALSLRLHSRHLEKIKSLCIVGGGSKNIFLRQLITDAFNTETYTIENADLAAPLGCAISGARHLLGLWYDEAAQRFSSKDVKTILTPQKENIVIIDHLINRYLTLESKRLSRVSALIE